MREHLRLILASFVVLVSTLAASNPASAHEVGDVSGLLAEVVDVIEANEAGVRFLDRYVDPDGRVVRHVQGGDTVSEGQAYAMTIAAAIGDETTFRKVWEWTRTELRRPDGLFSWHWADGAVTDEDPAADADLVVAGALALAARRFDDATLADDADAIGAAVLDLETTWIGGHRVLVAGPWAVGRKVVNPSYAVLTVMSELWRADRPEWADVAASSRIVLRQLTESPPHLPPDWATATGDGTLGIRAAPAGDPPRYGWDAARVPVQLAADCSADGRSVAARMWPFFAEQGAAVASVYDLDGTVVDPGAHAASLVGAAGAATAAGATASARELLDRATALDAEHPTYYGAAWVALGRLWLTTTLLGGCADA
jgi:endoglucanase